MIDADGPLVVGHLFFARVEVVVGIVAGANHGGLTHHGHAAHVHGVGKRCVFVQHDGGRMGEPARRNHILDAVVHKLLADGLRIRFADWEAGVEGGIGCSGSGIIDIHTALAEVARIFGCGGHRVDHGVDLDVTQTFIVDEEESFAGAPHGSAHRCAKVVLDQEIRSAHLVEGVSVQVAVAQELIGRAVKVA